MKVISVEILSNTFNNKVNRFLPSMMTTKRTVVSKVSLNSDPQQAGDESCLTSQNLHTILMDNDVSPDVSGLLDDVMNVIYDEVPRSVLQELVNTDTMVVKKGVSPSLQQRSEAMEALYPSSEDEQYQVQGTGSCSSQTFAKDAEINVLAIGIGRHEVSLDFAKTGPFSAEGTGSAGHCTPSCNDHITQRAYNDLIAYLKGPGHSTDGHFEDTNKDIQRSSIRGGTETPLLQKSIGTLSHVTMATEEGRSEDKSHQAADHCDDALVRRRVQNRKAAKKCRDKRLQNLKDLEQRVKLLLQQRSDLTEVRQRLLQVRTRLNQNSRV
ncbi:uncharacterized protein LOC124284187 [Haliotis rubra]|uniref:uncharacterized protein LOC124284187 n=1 Tax=Haliotis rubra TaxID=36100 RepID=UPI001EE5EC52|nr:uncharacterized protein LOC124284187 [Haliotis rubra]